MKLIDKFFRGWFVTSLILVLTTVAVAKFSYRAGGIWDIVNPDGGILNIGTSGEDAIQLLTDQAGTPTGWIVTGKLLP